MNELFKPKSSRRGLNIHFTLIQTWFFYLSVKIMPNLQ